MQLKRATLNGGAGMVVHAIDMDQPRCRAFSKLEALCGKMPGGGKTAMGARRSRWRQVGICPTDSPVVNCDKCLTKLEALGVDEATI